MEIISSLIDKQLLFSLDAFIFNNIFQTAEAELQDYLEQWRHSAIRVVTSLKTKRLVI